MRIKTLDSHTEIVILQLIFKALELNQSETHIQYTENV